MNLWGGDHQRRRIKMKLLHRRSIDELAATYVQALETMQTERFNREMASTEPALANPLLPDPLPDRALARPAKPIPGQTVSLLKPCGWPGGASPCRRKKRSA